MERRPTHSLLGATALAIAASLGACATTHEVPSGEPRDTATHEGVAGVDPSDAGAVSAASPGPQPAHGDGIDHCLPCGDTTCGPEEICCRVDAVCYPADCAGCCATFDEGASPDVDVPDPAKMPRGGLVGPLGGQAPPPSESPGDLPGVDRPAPDVS